MKASINKKAVLYFRPEEQKSNMYRDSIGEQLQKMYAYCQEKQYEIIEVFYDNSNLPHSFDESIFNEMLDIVDTEPTGSVVVVFNDLSNFRKDFRELLRIKICVYEQRCATIECLNFTFQDTPHGRLAEKTVDFLKQISVI